MPHKEEFPTGSNKKRGKTVQFDVTTEEVNSMTARDAPIPRKTEGEVSQRSLIVTRTLHFPKKMNILMGFTA